MRPSYGRRFRPTFAIIVGIAILWAVGVVIRSTAPSNRYLPNPALTPGDALPLTAADVCAPGYAQSVRSVPGDVRRRVFIDYGVQFNPPGEYELDHLIPVELGGSDDRRNLWPESYRTQPWNAHAKDRLEDQLHRLVCSGRMGLAAAQQCIAGDWTGCYRRVFRTSSP